MLLHFAYFAGRSFLRIEKSERIKRQVAQHAECDQYDQDPNQIGRRGRQPNQPLAADRY